MKSRLSFLSLHSFTKGEQACMRSYKSVVPFSEFVYQGRGSTRCWFFLSVIFFFKLKQTCIRSHAFFFSVSLCTKGEETCLRSYKFSFSFFHSQCTNKAEQTCIRSYQITSVSFLQVRLPRENKLKMRNKTCFPAQSNTFFFLPFQWVHSPRESKWCQSWTSLGFTVRYLATTTLVSTRFIYLRSYYVCW